MIEFDELDKRMVLKLVYYGPALSGKTSNLLSLHDCLDVKGRGDLMVLDTRNDRTIFFDLLPFYLLAPSGLKIKVKVYTVPGQVEHDATRKAVLARADGIAFIADSQISESANNVESFRNLEQNLALVGLPVTTVPLVIQFNKRDLSEITPEESIRKLWEATEIPLFMSSALKGRGVLETFKCLAERAYAYINHQYHLESEHGVSKQMFVDTLTHLSPDSRGQCHGIRS